MSFNLGGIITKIKTTRRNSYIKKQKNVLLSGTKEKTVSIFLINITIVIVLLFLGAIQFETIDDYMIYELLSGKWGQATSYTVYINIFLSKVLVSLFKLVPSVNWYVLMLLSTHIISFTTLGYLINKRFKNGMYIYALVLITIYIPLLVFLQYTSQSAILILVGCLFSSNIITNNDKKYKLIFPGVLILLGSLIRFDSLMCVLPYVGLMFILRLINNKLHKKEIILKVCFYLVTLLSCFILKQVHINIYNTNSIYKEYLEYNNIRTFIHDYLGNNYNQNIEVYNKVGWSINDYNSMMLFNNADDLVFSIDKMKYIINNVKIVFPSLKVFLNNILLNAYLIPYLLILLITTYISVKEGREANILIAILAIVLEFVFVLMSKVNVRTCMLNYIIAIIFMIGDLEKVKEMSEVNLKAFFEIIAVIIIIIVNISTIKENKSNNLAKSYNEFIGYVNNNKQNAYVYSRIWIKW